MTAEDQVKNTYSDDDGHTIADMSVLPDRRSLFSGRHSGAADAPGGHHGVDGAVAGNRVGMSKDTGAPVYMGGESEMSLKNRLSMMFGALGAALAIGLVYLVVFALVILLLLWVWRA